MITSTSNDQVKAVKRLHTPKGRRDAGRTLVEGENGLEALRSSHLVPTSVFGLPDDDGAMEYCRVAGVAFTPVSDHVLRAMSDVESPVGPVMVIETPSFRPMGYANTVALVDVADPGNVGTVVRTATALGWAVAVYGSTADPWSPKAIRASAGTVFRAAISRGIDPIADASANDLTSVAMVLDGDEAVDLAGAPAMLIIGSEARGLPSAIRDDAELLWTIAMADGVESFNAAAAAAIGMYALS